MQTNPSLCEQNPVHTVKPSCDIQAKAVRYVEYDYANVKAAVGRNRIHDYPAMLHSLMVDSLLKEFAGGGTIVYDPFCGSGTTLVQAASMGFNCYGTDINPLALLIAKVRCTNIDYDDLQLSLSQIQANYPHSACDLPKVTKIEYWFNENVIIDLGKLRLLISSIENIDIRSFLMVCLSSTVRKVSNNKPGEFKRVRKKSPDSSYQSNVLDLFLDYATEYSDMLKYNPIHPVQINIIKHDTRNPMKLSSKFDLVITSPPYGDSRTTVAYGQFSSFSHEWLRGMNPFGDEDLSLDKKLLGGMKEKADHDIASNSFYRSYCDIAKIDKSRAGDVRSFTHDLQRCIKQITVNLNPGGVVCFIVGNRIVKDTLIPLDTISKEMFETYGLDHFETRVRQISMKRMPSKNSPSNVSGITSNTMTNEYIVIMKKRECHDKE